MLRHRWRANGDPIEVLPIWPDLPPGSEGVTAAEETVERDNALGLRDRIVLGIRHPGSRCSAREADRAARCCCCPAADTAMS